MAVEPTAIRRIMVAMDASAASLSAMHSAVDLASRLGAELIGLYVEDINLLRLAQLPIAHEINAFSETLRRLDPMDLERLFRDEAARVRKATMHACGQRGVPCRFEVFRGVIAAELLAAAAQADLMVVGKIGRSYFGTKRVGSITRMLVSRRTGMTLILQSGALLTTLPVLVLYDGSAQAHKSLAVAAHLARAPQGRMTVFIVADNSHDARRFETQVQEYLQIYELNAVFRRLVRDDLSSIAQRIRIESEGPVVIPCDVQAQDGEQLCSLIGEISNPVLLVR
jgi:nucleotide-binding universal stress UspA family protein